MAITDKQAEAFEKVKQKSDDDYEKNVVYIAAGTLVLSMTFLEKIIKVESSTLIWVLISSWAFLACTLLCNLLSHQLSSVFHERCRDLFDDCDEPAEDATDDVRQIYNQNLAIANGKFDYYNDIIRYLNWGTTSSLFVGIALLVVFCSANALKANSVQKTDYSRKLNDKTMSKQIKPQTQDSDISKGRTISPSVKPSTQQSSSASSNSGNQSGNSGSGSNQSGNK